MFHFACVEEAMYDPGADDPYAVGGSTAPSDMGAPAGGQVISQLLEGLRPDTTYHFKVVAFNQAGRVVGTDGTFTTGAATPPTVVTGGASNVAENTATISGAVDTNGLPTTYGFEIGTSTDYGPPTGLGALGPVQRARVIRFDRSVARHDLPLPSHGNQHRRYDLRRGSDIHHQRVREHLRRTARAVPVRGRPTIAFPPKRSPSSRSRSRGRRRKVKKRGKSKKKAKNKKKKK